MKRAVSVLMAIAILVSFSATAFAQSEPSDWAVNEVDYKAARFLENTMSEEVDYAKDITREEFAMIALYLYNAVTDTAIPQMNIRNPFSDCNNPMVVTAYGLGLVKGVSDDSFNPNAPVTREQICVMIARIATLVYPELKNESVLALLGDLSQFKDCESVSDWAEESVKMMVFAGLIKGTDEGNINPLGNCTVQEALIIAKRALSY